MRVTLTQVTKTLEDLLQQLIRDHNAITQAQTDISKMHARARLLGKRGGAREQQKSMSRGLRECQEEVQHMARQSLKLAHPEHEELARTWAQPEMLQLVDRVATQSREYYRVFMGYDDVTAGLIEEFQLQDPELSYVANLGCQKVVQNEIQNRAQYGPSLPLPGDLRRLSERLHVLARTMERIKNKRGQIGKITGGRRLSDMRSESRRALKDRHGFMQELLNFDGRGRDQTHKQPPSVVIFPEKPELHVEGEVRGHRELRYHAAMGAENVAQLVRAGVKKLAQDMNLSTDAEAGRRTANGVRAQRLFSNVIINCAQKALGPTMHGCDSQTLSDYQRLVPAFVYATDAPGLLVTAGTGTGKTAVATLLISLYTRADMAAVLTSTAAMMSNRSNDKDTADGANVFTVEAFLHGCDYNLQDKLAKQGHKSLLSKERKNNKSPSSDKPTREEQLAVCNEGLTMSPPGMANPSLRSPRMMQLFVDACYNRLATDARKTDRPSSSSSRRPNKQHAVFNTIRSTIRNVQPRIPQQLQNDDPLTNTLIVIDEAHHLFDNEGGYCDYFKLRDLLWNSFAVHGLSHSADESNAVHEEPHFCQRRHARCVVLTATPMRYSIVELLWLLALTQPPPDAHTAATGVIFEAEMDVARGVYDRVNREGKLAFDWDMLRAKCSEEFDEDPERYHTMLARYLATSHSHYSVQAQASHVAIAEILLERPELTDLQLESLELCALDTALVRDERTGAFRVLREEERFAAADKRRKEARRANMTEDQRAEEDARLERANLMRKELREMDMDPDELAGARAEDEEVDGEDLVLNPVTGKMERSRRTRAGRSYVEQRRYCLSANAVWPDAHMSPAKAEELLLPKEIRSKLNRADQAQAAVIRLKQISAVLYRLVQNIQLTDREARARIAMFVAHGSLPEDHTLKQYVFVPRADTKKSNDDLMAVVEVVLRLCLGYTHFGEKSDLAPTPGRVMIAVNSKRQGSLRSLVNAFNSEENVYGQQASLIMLSDKNREGISLTDVFAAHVVGAFQTGGDRQQAIGRASRYCSHRKLPTQLFMEPDDIDNPKYRLFRRVANQRYANPNLAALSQDALWTLYVFVYSPRINKQSVEKLLQADPDNKAGKSRRDEGTQLLLANCIELAWKEDELRRASELTELMTDPEKYAAAAKK